MLEDNNNEEDSLMKEEEEANSEKEKGSWKIKPKIEDLKRDYENAKQIHDGDVSEIRETLDYLHVRGKAKFPKKKNRSSITPKLIRKQAEWRYASLSDPFLSTNDMFKVMPVSFEDREAAYQNELILNYQLSNKINKVKFVNDFIHKLVDEGTAITRVGWNYQEEVFQHDYSDEDIAKFTQLNVLAQENPEIIENNMLLRMELKIFNNGGREVNVLKNEPTAEIVNFEDVVVDPSCDGDMDKAKFAVYEFKTSLSELRAETDLYINLDKLEKSMDSAEADESTGSSFNLSDEELSDSTFNFKDTARKQFTAYEYWGYLDIDGDGLLESVVIVWVNDTIIRMDENPFPDKKIPFIVTQYMHKYGSIRGECDGYLLKDNQDILGATMRGIIDIMGRSANAQRGFAKGALDPVNAIKFKNGEDYEFNPLQMSTKDIFQMHTFSEIPRSAMELIQLQNNEAESLTGIKAYTGGISGQALGSTATGIRSALDATSKRELSILRNISDGIKEMGKRFVSMNAQWLSDEEVIRVTNDEMIAINREDLAGEFDLKLEISTPESDEVKAQELSFMLQTTGQTMDSGLQKMILINIAKLRKMPDLAKQIEEFEAPKPTKEDLAKVQLELGMMEAEATKDNALAEQYLGQVELDQAKGEAERARAKEHEAKADLINLEFIEKETGTSHERDIDAIERKKTPKAPSKEKGLNNE